MHLDILHIVKDQRVSIGAVCRWILRRVKHTGRKYTGGTQNHPIGCTLALANGGISD